MAYDNVNTTSLINSLNACKDALNYYRCRAINDSLSNPSIWESDVKYNIQRAIDSLVNDGYKELERMLNDYIATADNINNYQKLEKEHASLKSNCNTLENELKEEKKDRWYEDENGKWQKATKNETKINEIENNLKNTKTKINEISSKMDNLQNTINNSI